MKTEKMNAESLRWGAEMSIAQTPKWTLDPQRSQIQNAGFLAAVLETRRQ